MEVIPPLRVRGLFLSEFDKSRKQRSIDLHVIESNPAP